MAAAALQQAGADRASWIWSGRSNSWRTTFDHIKDPHERERKERDRDQALEKARNRKKDLMAHRPVLAAPADLAGLQFRKGQLLAQLGDLWRQGQELISRNASVFQSYESLQAKGNELREKILDRYDSLKADPEVKRPPRVEQGARPRPGVRPWPERRCGGAGGESDADGPRDPQVEAPELPKKGTCKSSTAAWARPGNGRTASTWHCAGWGTGSRLTRS